VRSNVVELLAPAIESTLGCSGGLIGNGLDIGADVAVHPLVAAVVLRASGARPYDAYAERDPPHRQARESAARLGANERNAVIALDCPWKAVRPEERLELSSDPFHRRSGHHRDAQHEPAEGVPHRQRLASRAVLRPPPTLEVHAPNIVGCRHRDLWGAVDDTHDRFPSPLANLAEA